VETGPQQSPQAVRARVEYALAGLKSWNILRNCRRKRDGAYYATSGVALMRNFTMTICQATTSGTRAPQSS
jgi:hypothetical protein